MTINNYTIQNMLRTYDEQMNTGRRIKRLNRYLRRYSKKGTNLISNEDRRKQMVEKVAAEVIENLLTSKSDNPMVKEIKKKMEEKLQSRLVFFYPPNGDEMQILKGDPKDSTQLTEKEREKLMHILWETTIKTVNETML